MNPIAVVSPYPSDSQRGNSVSARRIAGLLASLGHEVRVWEREEFIEEGYPDLDLLVLHARRSADVIETHAERRNPRARFVCVLPGSDLHADLLVSGLRRETVLRSLELADDLVVAQEGSVQAVPDRFLNKLQVIVKSVNLPAVPAGMRPPSDRFRVVFVAHLRQVKQPRLLETALPLLPAESRIEVEHYGVAEDPELGAWARAFSESSDRYRWCGSIERSEVPALFASSHLSINLSSVEGGANAIAESIVAGTPVLVSGIPPNLGMVGANYPGVFADQDAGALAEILSSLERDQSFYEACVLATRERGCLFSRERERAAWAELFPPGDLDRRPRL